MNKIFVKVIAPVFLINFIYYLITNDKYFSILCFIGFFGTAILVKLYSRESGV
jgi:hypothetical protein